MDKKDYCDAIGFIVTYKPLDESLLFNEMRSRLSDIELQSRGESSSAFYVNDYSTVVEEIHKEDFIFLRHIHPFMNKIDIDGKLSDFDIYLAVLEKLLPMLASTEIIVCQCRIDSSISMEYTNKELTALLASFLQDRGYIIAPQDAMISVSLTVYGSSAYMGISFLMDNVSDWTGGILFYSKSNDIICRAEFKIEEACNVFNVQISDGMRALDLGAAPGGWTHYLSRKGLFIDAIDPANLSADVLKLKNVKHHKMTAQEFAAIASFSQYDIMVNDMKMDTNQSVDITCEMSNQLRKGGICLMTLKLPKSGVMKRIHIAQKVLGRKFETVRIRKLYYNRSEVTVYAIK